MRVISKEKSNAVKSSASAKKTELLSMPSSSRMLSGPMAHEIHQENVGKLKEMTEDEILEEKKNLEAMLDPKMIAFIKSMKESRNKSEKQTLHRNSNDMEVDKGIAVETKMDINSESNDIKMETDAQDIDKDLPEPVVEIVKDAEKKGWVHMDDLEPEKVQWMEDLPVEKTTQQPPEEPYNARFDFHGKLKSTTSL